MMDAGDDYPLPCVVMVLRTFVEHALPPLVLTVDIWLGADLLRYHIKGLGRCRAMWLYPTASFFLYVTPVDQLLFHIGGDAFTNRYNPGRWITETSHAIVRAFGASREQVEPRIWNSAAMLLVNNILQHGTRVPLMLCLARWLTRPPGASSGHALH